MHLLELLHLLRQKRAFNSKTYLSLKTTAINSFFNKNGLNAAVIGLSGGVDSALVASLLSHASLQENSPIQKIVAIIAPIDRIGTSGQLEATNKAIAQAELLKSQNANFDYKVCPLGAAYDEIVKTAHAPEANAWAQGQMASILRTPLFYYQAALLQQNGYGSIVVGTTNRDEGAYIGFFGKASDAMVDLQPIADLHKSEVYQVAKDLGVLYAILKDAPRGDVWDALTDEEMIGVPYWFVELYLLILEYNCENEFLALFTIQERIIYQKYKETLEERHQKNAHKYEVGQPAHFIDILARKIPNGWK